MSYPLYIIHYPFIYLFGHWVWNTHPDRMHLNLVAAGLYLWAIGLATALLYFYDKPVRAWLAKRYISS